MLAAAAAAAAADGTHLAFTVIAFQRQHLSACGIQAVASVTVEALGAETHACIFTWC